MPTTFETALARMTATLKERAVRLRRMRVHVMKAVELKEAGKDREALTELRKAEELQKKLGLSSRRR